MCSINHDLKAIYFHIPKVGGLYIQEILDKIYDFKTYYFTSENHLDYIDNNDNQIENYKGFLNIRKKGIYRYFRYSEKFNLLANMNEDKWNSYFKFTFVRNPLTKCISAYKYLNQFSKNMLSLNNILNNNKLLNNYQYFHLCISQYDQLVNNDNNIDFDFIGRFENLNEDLIIALNKIGISELKHKYYIENNIFINSDKSDISTKNLIDEEIVVLINDIYSIDYEKFNYNKSNLSDYIQILNNEKNINEKNKNILTKYNFIEQNDFINIISKDKVIEVFNNIKITTDIRNNIQYKNNFIKII